MEVIVHTRTPSETIRLGKRIGRLLDPGDIVALIGELGTGKTHLIKGLAAGAGIKDSSYVSSPSFTLIHEYSGKVPFYHIDLYRLGSEKEAEELGLEECLGGTGIAAIEWADKIPSLLPGERLLIRLSYVDERSRSIKLSGTGRHYEDIVESLNAAERDRPRERKCSDSRSVER
jgi:tRNA threonylcarbamoyladenosine biosynthesis protein TsaE